MSPLKSKAKENIIMASAPTISKNGARPLKNDTGGRFSKANPVIIEAKNNSANSFNVRPPFSLKYDF